MNAKPTFETRFTVATAARENGINPKIARRRLRDRARRNEAPAVPTRRDWTDGRLGWEFQNRQSNLILNIIAA